MSDYGQKKGIDIQKAIISQGITMQLPLAAVGSAPSQEIPVLKGRVVDGRDSVPYATLQPGNSTIDTPPRRNSNPPPKHRQNVKFC